METITKKKKSAAERKTFIRSFSYEGNGHKVSGVFQPYCVGMYAAITDSRASGLIQLSLTHKSHSTWCKRLFKRLEKDGMTGESVVRNYIDYLTEEEINDYVL